MSSTQTPTFSPTSASAAAVARIDVKAMPRVLTRLTKLALRYPARVCCAVAAAFGAAFLNLVTPRLLGSAVDDAHRLLVNGEAHALATRHALLVTALLIVGACAIRGSLTGLQGYLGESLAQHVGYDLRLAFFEKLQQLPFAFHDVTHSGDLIARGMLDLEGVRAFLESALLRVITLVLLVGVGSWRLVGTDPSLALLALGFVPFVVWRAARMGVMLRVSWQRLQELMSELTLGMEENLQGVRVVRAFASQALELARFDRVSDAALRLSNQRIGTRMRAMSSVNFAYYVSMGLVLWVGGHRVRDGILSVGTLTEFLTFITILQQPLRQIGMIVNSSARATSSATRLFAVLDVEPSIQDRPGASDLRIGQGVLRFDAVTFAYGSRTILSDISFEVQPGRTLGIVGAPGSGKSTLAHLIPRFYDVTEGRITIDGVDIRDVTLASLRQAVGLVQQDAFLFDTSIHANIAYADPPAEDERVIGAATAAQIHDHVAQLPTGYATRVGERGVGLSGGQRQRVSIARGLLAAPLILVLDDSTAAIDALTEQQVRAALRRHGERMATIVVAHRLGSLMYADEIIVLEAGRIVERGTHAQLLALGGRYASLWTLQNQTSPTGTAQAELQS
jgi:ATP-binding cassette, subfamily B, multidrug efflux pump